MARRWPGLTRGQPLWLFLTAHYTETAPQASKEAVKKGNFFSTQCGKCAGESPQVLTGQLPTRLASLVAFCCISSLLCSPPTTSRYFPSVAATR